MTYKGKKSLVIYFSRADENYKVGYIDKGNTEILAEFIRDYAKADLFKVERKQPYPVEYNDCIKETKDEYYRGQRPELKKELKDISKYEVIYIGTPLYWDGMPMPLIAQLEKLDFTGKTVRFFTTHEGGGLANVPRQVKDYCKGATVLEDGLAIYGHEAKFSKERIEQWI
jgi:flavodoxin